MNQKKIETKVQAGSAAALVAGALVWALGHYVLKGAVPPAAAAAIYAVVPGALTFLAAYLAPHTHRRPAPPPG
jgi:drug/metabolite transporter (DMT)-like permease